MRSKSMFKEYRLKSPPLLFWLGLFCPSWQGNAAYKEKQWQKAVNFYTEAIKLNGKMATYYSNRAAAFLELTKYDFPPYLAPFFFQILMISHVSFFFNAPLLIGDWPVGPFSYRQAEADCTSAIDLDPKVRSWFFPFGTFCSLYLKYMHWSENWKEIKDRILKFLIFVFAICIQTS